jgi:hypothetical protein
MHPSAEPCAAEAATDSSSLAVSHRQHQGGSHDLLPARPTGVGLCAAVLGGAGGRDRHKRE